VGIIVGKRVGNAIVRNRIKRRIREATRALYDRLLPGYDIVYVARPPGATATFVELSAAVETLARRAQLLRPAAEMDASARASDPGGMRR
jgi:ribonuclease P protein component